jgi:hypothetical protein
MTQKEALSHVIDLLLEGIEKAPQFAEALSVLDKSNLELHAIGIHLKVQQATNKVAQPVSHSDEEFLREMRISPDFIPPSVQPMPPPAPRPFLPSWRPFWRRGRHGGR